MSRVPPSNLDAERAVLGAMLIKTAAIETACEILEAVQFYKPEHGHIFDAICAVHGSRPGDADPAHNFADPVTVADQLERMGLLAACGGDKDKVRQGLVRLQAEVPATTTVRRYAKIVADHHLLRLLIDGAGEIAELSYERPADVSEAVERASDIILRVKERRLNEWPDGLEILDDFLEEAEAEGDDFAPWLVGTCPEDGLLKRDWRVTLVAGPGSGKTQILQQVAMGAAAGIHPFTQQLLPAPIRVVHVDLENPRERLRDGVQTMYPAAIRDGEWTRGNYWQWRRPDGIYLTTHTGRAEFEQVLRIVRPDLVCIGPIYKADNMDGADGIKIAADVMGIFDEFRVRYGFALLAEVHPPNTDAGAVMRQKGTSRWRDWPDIGLALVEVEDLDAPVGKPGDPVQPRVFDLRRTRGDRLKNGWPARLRHSRGAVDGPWPWIVEKGTGEPDF